ncbi:hypothetical protein V493_03855 [Pseudogymnoascus sp. VKM F-4281 (FW-2241)]|nr:hypothetical protein V493_03855 [Pseudogymnoascus sp. VKM F-4281 (FW-2241)]
MQLAKFFHGCLCTAIVFSAAGIACPDYNELPHYKSLNKSDLSYDELTKRWYTVIPSDGPSREATTWPDSTIPYCFEDDNSRDKLQDLIESAWKLWQASGVNYRIDMGEYNSCPEPVDGKVPPSKKSKYLLVRTLTNGEMVTSIGTQMYGKDGGPLMKFDPSPNIGMRDPVANMMHEIGHAWGFFHEQQRPSFWKQGEYAEGKGSENQINFDCEKMSDYATQAGPLDGTKNDACHSFAKARFLNFSASEFLPMNLPFSDQLDDGDYDWKSIMLYASPIGGRVVNGVPLNVYTRASDGKVISYNKTPSQRDVSRFNSMYSEKAPYPNPCLINQGCHPKKAVFMNVKAKCKNLGSS